MPKSFLEVVSAALCLNFCYKKLNKKLYITVLEHHHAGGNIVWHLFIFYFCYYSDLSESSSSEKELEQRYLLLAIVDRG